MKKCVERPSTGAVDHHKRNRQQLRIFIFHDRGTKTASLPPGPIHTLSSNMEGWTQVGLQYFVVGEVGPGDIEALSKLLRGAA